jgi:glycerophosphoryl diester phosphodiesterase
LKTSKANDSIKNPPIEEFVDGLMKIVNEKNLATRCYLQSFDFRPLQILHKKYPHIVTAVLIGGNEKRSLDDVLTDLGYNPQMYSPHYSLVTAELVKACHDKGIKLIPWTVNTVEEMKKMKALGVDGIITDYPNYFSEL